jgi:hypothetical protein
VPAQKRIERISYQVGNLTKKDFYKFSACQNFLKKVKIDVEKKWEKSFPTVLTDLLYIIYNIVRFEMAALPVR